MNVQPIVLIGASRSFELKTVFLDRLMHWWDIWASRSDLLPDLDVRESKPIRVESCDDILKLSESGRPLEIDLIVEKASDSEANILWHVSQELEFRLFAFICGLKQESEEHSSSLISDIVRDLMKDLVTTLLKLKSSTIITETAKEVAKYSKLDYEVLNPLRYFRLEISVGDVGINVWVPKSFLATDNAEQLLPDGAPHPVSRHQALEERGVSLYVTLGEAEITIEELGNLKVGDVIGLDKNLDEPLSMERAGSEPRFIGYLGSTKGQFGFLVDSIE